MVCHGIIPAWPWLSPSLPLQAALWEQRTEVLPETPGALPQEQLSAPCPRAVCTHQPGKPALLWLPSLPTVTAASCQAPLKGF